MSATTRRPASPAQGQRNLGRRDGQVLIGDSALPMRSRQLRRQRPTLARLRTRAASRVCTVQGLLRAGPHVRRNATRSPWARPTALDRTASGCRRPAIAQASLPGRLDFSKPEVGDISVGDHTGATLQAGTGVDGTACSATGSSRHRHRYVGSPLASGTIVSHTLDEFPHSSSQSYYQVNELLAGTLAVRSSVVRVRPASRG
jgi:hypothetical protein